MKPFIRIPGLPRMIFSIFVVTIKYKRVEKNCFIIVLLFLFSSCYKTENDTGEICTSGCTVIRGRVTTLNDRPVPDVTIKIRSHRNTSTVSGITRYIAETKSDANGYYSMKFSLNEYESGSQAFAEVYLQYSYNETFYTPVSGSTRDVLISSPRAMLFTIKEVTVDRSIYLPLKAKANLRFQGFYTSGSDRNSLIIMPSFRTGLYNSYLNGATTVGTLTVDTTLSVDVAGNDTTRFHVEKWKSGQRIMSDTSVFTPLGQTTNLVFSF